MEPTVLYPEGTMNASLTSCPDNLQRVSVCESDLVNHTISNITQTDERWLGRERERETPALHTPPGGCSVMS